MDMLQITIRQGQPNDLTGQNLLTSDVSKTAKSFFERVGFNVTKEQIIIRQGIELTNFKMTKELH